MNKTWLLGEGQFVQRGRAPPPPVKTRETFMIACKLD